ncbi:hypothetical protein [Aestuariibacter salexigens]|uniref:hypothetical protein n=1 Tax=Aestuariibacter salexigens TaxID=226010 RepID=UPI00041CEA9E|nr:hypothetical protein [Aestuariibacter salexigens]
MEVGSSSGASVGQAVQSQQQPSQTQQIRQQEASQQTAELETASQQPQPAPSANERVGSNVDTFA